MVSPLIGGMAVGFAEASKERSAAAAAAKEAAERRTFESQEAAKDRTFREGQNDRLIQNRLDVAELNIKAQKQTSLTNRAWTTFKSLKEDAKKTRQPIAQSTLPSEIIDQLNHIKIYPTKDSSGIFNYNFHNAIAGANQEQLDTHSENVMNLNVPFNDVGEDIQKNIAKLHFGGNMPKANAVLSTKYEQKMAKEGATLRSAILTSRQFAGVTGLLPVPGDPTNFINSSITPERAILNAVPNLGENGAKESIKSGNAQRLIQVGELHNIETQLGEAAVSKDIRKRGFLQKFATERLKKHFMDLNANPWISYTSGDGSINAHSIKISERFPHLKRLFLDEITFKHQGTKLTTFTDIAKAISLATKGKLKLTPFAVEYKMADNKLTIDYDQPLPAKTTTNPERKDTANEVVIKVKDASTPNHVTASSVSKNTALAPILAETDNGEIAVVNFDPVLRSNSDVQEAISLLDLRRLDEETFDADPKNVIRYNLFKPYFDGLLKLASATKSDQSISNPEGDREYKKLYDMIDKGIPQTDGTIKNIFDLQGSVSREKLIHSAIKEGLVRMLSIGATETGGTARGPSWGLNKNINIQTRVRKKTGVELKNSHPEIYELRKNSLKTKEKLDLVMPQVKRFSVLRTRIGDIDKLLDLHNNGFSSNWDNPEKQALAQQLRRQILNDPQVKFGISLTDSKTQTNWEKFVNSPALAGSRSEGFMPRWLNTTAQFLKDALYTTKMAGGMFNIGSFGGIRRKDGQGTVNGSGLLKVGGENVFYNDKGQPIYASTWSTPRDAENQHIGKAVHEKFENQVLPQLQKVHANAIDKAQQALDDAQKMQPGNDKDAAIDDASLKLLKSYLMARRDFLKVSLTYYYAGLVQGESGGRAISNEDYQILFNALWGNVGGPLAAGAFDEFNETITGIQERNAANIQYLGLGPDTTIADAVISLQRSSQRVLSRRAYDQSVNAQQQREQTSKRRTSAEIPTASFNIGAFGRQNRLRLKSDYNKVVGSTHTKIASEYAGTDKKFRDYVEPSVRRSMFKNIVRSLNDAIKDNKNNLKRLNNIPGGDFKLGDTLLKYGKLLDLVDTYNKSKETAFGKQPETKLLDGKRVQTGKTVAKSTFDDGKKQIGLSSKEGEWLQTFVENFFNNAIGV